MSMYEGYSLIYPPNYNELAAKHADAARLSTQDNMLSGELANKIARPADATARGLGDLAIQSMTGGILQPTYDTDAHTHEFSPTRRHEQSLVLGAVSLRDYMLRDAAPFVISEEAVLGSAELRQAA